MEHLNVYKKSSRKDAKDAKLLFVILSLYFQDFYFEFNISCIMLKSIEHKLCASAPLREVFCEYLVLQNTRSEDYD